MVRIALVALLCLLSHSPALAEKRVALVVGNSAYQHTPKLTNPKNDATDISAALKKHGFHIVEAFDLDKAAFDRKVRDFAAGLQGAQVAVFFYAGHGLQVGGQNYLVPIDAELKTASAIDFELVRLELVQRTMERETSTNILFMDACRDNPLARNLARALGTRSTQIGRGLAPVESGEGTLIGYSTQPGNVALDGEGRNSPYAEALLKHIATPGDDLPTILINVRNDVMRVTQRKQVPWEHSAMTARFYFIPPKPPGYQVELDFWASVKDSTSPAVLGTYLERYPNGEFALIAQALIEHFQRQLKAELAAREEARRREEEERKAAEVKRLEEEHRAREAAISKERKRAEEAKSAADISRLDEQAKAEWLARTEDLRKALEEARLAREAAAAAEKQRLAAVRAAEEATKAAEQTIATRRAGEREGDPTKVAVLPKLEKPQTGSSFDGTWYLRRLGPSCSKTVQDVRMAIFVAGGVVSGRGPVGPITGTVSAIGQLSFAHGSWAGPDKAADGFKLTYQGSLHGNGGSGTFNATKPGSNCSGTFTATRG
jgi:caspase domain-containing protein